jgi:hypothetical protein
VLWILNIVVCRSLNVLLFVLHVALAISITTFRGNVRQDHDAQSADGWSSLPSAVSASPSGHETQSSLSLPSSSSFSECSTCLPSHYTAPILSSLCTAWPLVTTIEHSREARDMFIVSYLDNFLKSPLEHLELWKYASQSLDG